MARINARHTIYCGSAKIALFPTFDLFVGECGTILVIGWLIFYVQFIIKPPKDKP